MQTAKPQMVRSLALFWFAAVATVAMLAAVQGTAHASLAKLGNMHRSDVVPSPDAAHAHGSQVGGDHAHWLAAAHLARAIDDEACETSAKPYRAAYAAHRKRLDSYWSQVKRLRSRRSKRRKQGKAIRKADYALSFPPKYSGPKAPKCLAAIAKRKAKKRPRKPSTIGTVKDFLAAAKRFYNFTPRAPRDELEFKLAYAREALALGMTKNQIIGVYSLETGGIGPYNRQSGIHPLDYQCNPIKPKGRPASTALGYSQLLSANSQAVIKERGDKFARRLEFQAVQEQGARRSELMAKAAVLRKMQRDIARGIRKYSNRNNWREFVKFGKTPRGYAVHAMNLDVDVGPMMQVNKLRKIVDVSERRGHRNISGAKLELMNLAGYGRGLEMLTPVARDVPTSNFFSRGGYARNPVVSGRSSAGLLAKIDEIIGRRKKNCGAQEFIRVFQSLESQ